MFDGDLTSVVAIFAGIAALIAYISQRAKRKLNTNGQVLKLKKMSGSVTSQPQGSGLEEWNFPQPADDTTRPSTIELPSAPVLISTSAQAKPTPNSPTYQEIAPSLKHANRRTPKNTGVNYPRLGTRGQLKDSIVTMTILGPCRALAPFQDRE